MGLAKKLTLKKYAVPTVYPANVNIIHGSPITSATISTPMKPIVQKRGGTQQLSKPYIDVMQKKQSGCDVTTVDRICMSVNYYFVTCKLLLLSNNHLFEAFNIKHFEVMM